MASLILDGPDATLAYVDRHTPAAAGPKLLINSSRGPVIRERALDRPDVGAMILDVWDGEPELAWARLGDPRLWLVSPHVAGYSLEAKLAATRMMHEALCAFLGRAPSWTAAELLEPRVLTGPLEGFSSPGPCHHACGRPRGRRRSRACAGRVAACWSSRCVRAPASGLSAASRIQVLAGAGRGRSRVPRLAARRWLLGRLSCRGVK